MDANRHKRLKALYDAAIRVPREDQTRWLEAICGDDAALLAEVQKLLATADANAAFLEQPAAMREAALIHESPTQARKPAGKLTDTEPRRIGHYVLRHRLGEGGMGVVYLAERESNGGTGGGAVAIKLMRGTVLSDDARRRFEREQRLLRALDHPNIARLLDVGTTEDKHPYFVMEYVRGLSLDRYCDENRLSTEERLAIFRKVCDAVHYVHQNLIIHRDIKPSNILVTADGEPKLLDFGISRLVNPALEPAVEVTRPGFRLLTPRYASPEQVRDLPLTTGTDIYSLGVLLYELLTGHWPYRLKTTEVREIEQAICEFEPERPSAAVNRTEGMGPEGKTGPVDPSIIARVRGGAPGRIRSELRGDLDNVLLKALDKSPKRRYESAAQFADDIRRHIANETVIARPPSVRYRVGKFVRRNRTLVIAGALLLMSLAGGAIVATREWRRAEANLVEARRAQAEAETVSAALWTTSTTLITNIDPRLRRIEGAAKAREEIATIAAEQLENLRMNRPRDPKLLTDLSNALRVLGETFGGPRSANQGDVDRALALQQQALEIRQALLDAEPNHPGRMTLVGESHVCLGDLRRLAGRFSQAVGHYELAVPLLEKVSQDGEYADSARGRLASALAGLSECALELGDYDRALEAHRRAQSIREERAQNSNDPLARRNLSVGLMDEATILTRQGKSAEAIEVLERVVPMRRELLRETPADVRRRRDLVEALRALAYAYLANDDARSALEPAEKAVRIIESLVADEAAAAGGDASDQRVWQSNATALLTLAEAARLTGDLTRAEMLFNRVIDATAPRLNASSGNVAARELWLQASIGLAQVMLEQQRMADAEKLLTRSLDVSIADSAMNDVTPGEIALTANLRSLLADAIEAQCGEQTGAGQAACEAKVKAQRERALTAYRSLDDAGRLPARFKNDAAALAEKLNGGALK